MQWNLNMWNQTIILNLNSNKWHLQCHRHRTFYIGPRAPLRIFGCSISCGSCILNYQKISGKNREFAKTQCSWWKKGHVRWALGRRSIYHARLGKQLKAGSGKSSVLYLHAIHECGLVEDFLDRCVFLKKNIISIIWKFLCIFFFFQHWFCNFTDVHEKS